MKPDNDGLEALFRNTWPDLVRTMTTDREYADIQKSLDWVEKLLHNNVPGGKLKRGLGLIRFYRAFVKDEAEREDELCFILAWCLEIAQSACLIADDMMDNSLTRRGKDCWHRIVGLDAVCDVLLLENLVYQIIDKYFGGTEYELTIYKVIHKTTYRTCMGQSLDSKQSRSTIDQFRQELYASIVRYKTSYYTFQLPILLAMILAGVKDDSIYSELKNIMLKMGYLFQVQDDFLDCYGDPEYTGKVGTDILDGKCTWLVVQALALATTNQRNTIHECYGKKSVEDQDKVKCIYDELKIPTLFYRFEDEAVKEIRMLVVALPSSFPKAPLNNMLNTMYRREK